MGRGATTWSVALLVVASAACSSPQETTEGGNPPKDAVPPVYEYAQIDEDGCAIMGGCVYRGAALPELQGWYVFADFCLGNVTAFRSVDGEAEVEPVADLKQVASFGQDQEGELYVLSLSGAVFKLVP